MAMSARRTLETLTPGASAVASSIRKKVLPFISAECGSCRAWLPSIFHRIRTRGPTKRFLRGNQNETNQERRLADSPKNGEDGMGENQKVSRKACMDSD